MSYIRVIALLLFHLISRFVYRLATQCLPARASVPTNVTQITPAWLLKHWHESGDKPSKHNHWLTQASLQWQWLGSQTTSRHLARFDGGGASSLAQTTFFMKSSAADSATALFCALYDLGLNEVKFYRYICSHQSISKTPTDVMPINNMPIRTPIAYVAEARPAGGDFVLLLEDLAAAKAQCKTVADGCTLSEAEKAIDALAALHAHFWQSPDFHDKLAWVPSSGMKKKLAINRILKQLAFNKVFTEYHGILPVRMLQHKDWLQHIDRSVLDNSADKPHTLLHGDPHLGNMYFQQGDIGFFDWQVVQRGLGMKDVSYFMIVSMPQALRETHQWALIERYVSQLQQQGIVYSLEEAKQDYRLNSIHPLVAAVVTAASGAMQETQVVEAALIRAANAMIDIDAIDVLAELN